MIVAARIGRLFRMDPVVVLDADTTEWLVRVAAFNVVVQDIQREKAKRGK